MLPLPRYKATTTSRERAISSEVNCQDVSTSSSLSDRFIVPCMSVVLPRQGERLQKLAHLTALLIALVTATGWPYHRRPKGAHRKADRRRVYRFISYLIFFARLRSRIRDFKSSWPRPRRKRRPDNAAQPLFSRPGNNVSRDRW